MQSSQKLSYKSKQQKWAQLITQYSSQNMDQKNKISIILSWIRIQHLYEFKKIYYESKGINKIIKQIKVLDQNNNSQQQQFQLILQGIIKKYVENSNKLIDEVYSLTNLENIIVSISQKMEEQLKNNKNIVNNNHDLNNNNNNKNNNKNTHSTNNQQLLQKYQPNQQQQKPPLISPSKPKTNSLFVQKITPLPEQNIFKNQPKIQSQIIQIQKQQQINKQIQQKNQQNQPIIQMKQKIKIQKQQKQNEQGNENQRKQMEEINDIKNEDNKNKNGYIDKENQSIKGQQLICEKEDNEQQKQEQQQNQDNNRQQIQNKQQQQTYNQSHYYQQKIPPSPSNLHSQSPCPLKLPPLQVSPSSAAGRRNPLCSILSNPFITKSFHHICKQRYLHSGKTFSSILQSQNSMPLNKWMVFCKQFQLISLISKSKLIQIFKQATQYKTEMTQQQFKNGLIILQDKLNISEQQFLYNKLSMGSKQQYKQKINSFKINYSGNQRDFFKEANIVQKDRRYERQLQEKFKKQQEIKKIKRKMEQNIKNIKRSYKAQEGKFQHEVRNQIQSRKVYRQYVKNIRNINNINNNHSVNLNNNSINLNHLHLNKSSLQQYNINIPHKKSIPPISLSTSINQSRIIKQNRSKYIPNNNNLNNLNNNNNNFNHNHNKFIQDHNSSNNHHSDRINETKFTRRIDPLNYSDIFSYKMSTSKTKANMADTKNYKTENVNYKNYDKQISKNEKQIIKNEKQIKQKSNKILLIQQKSPNMTKTNNKSLLSSPLSHHQQNESTFPRRQWNLNIINFDKYQQYQQHVSQNQSQQSDDILRQHQQLQYKINNNNKIIKKTIEIQKLISKYQIHQQKNINNHQNVNIKNIHNPKDVKKLEENWNKQTKFYY